MSTAAAGSLQQSPLLLRERKQLLDAVWIVALTAVTGSVTLLWFWRILVIPLAPALWSVAGYSLVYLAASAATDRLAASRALTLAIALLQGGNILFLGLLWHLCGGIDNPLFLTVFSIPVLSSAVILMRSAAYSAALLSIAAAIAVALLESIEVRWYLAQAGIPVGWLTPWLSSSALPYVHPFPGLDAPPAYLVTVLGLFAIFQIVTVLSADSLVSLLLRLYHRMAASRAALREIQNLFQTVLTGMAQPGLIVDRGSGQAIHASHSFLQRMLLTPEAIIGKGVFELVAFDAPEQVRGLLAGDGGEIPFCAYRVGPERRIARLRITVMEYQRRGYAYLAWEEITELYHLQQAFDASEDPLLILGGDDRLLYANRTARTQFGELHFGLAMGQVLEADGHPPGWWRHDEGGEETEAEREFSGRPYRVRCHRVQLPGGGGSALVLSFHDRSREHALYEQATRDPLTGAFNRRHLEEALASERARVRRGAVVSVAIVDLDYFKDVNDTLGHGGGDAALVHLVTTVQRELRSGDQLFRFGGDEFVILFPDTLPGATEPVLERVYQRLAAVPLSFDGHRRQIAISCGVARLLADGDDPLAAADRALYDAKEAGRGCFRIAEG